MKILLLSNINSAHTQKWALGLASSGINIGIFSLRKPEFDWYSNLGITAFCENKPSTTTFGKLQYIGSLNSLKRVIKEFKPDIVHAHYATSYGLLGALAGFHPYIISVWGSDIYDFPWKSIFHRAILKYNLKQADKILSTSHSMAKETLKYTVKKIEVIGFGIDLNVFKKKEVKSIFNEGDIVIGTIKSIEEIYGIKYLIEAFDIVRKRHNTVPVKLLLVGGGTKIDEYKKFCNQKGIESLVVFTGKVPQNTVPNYQNMMDVYVSLSSYSESFGVAALEAAACSKPVVVTDVSGFLEVTKDGVNGLIVPKRNSEAAAEAIEKIIFDKEFAKMLGENGRKNVEENYNWEDNLKHQIEVYNTILN